MESYEFEGKTTEDAIENASRELNIASEDMDIDVLEPGSAGIFGLVGGKKAKVRVTIKHAEEPEEAFHPDFERILEDDEEKTEIVEDESGEDVVLAKDALEKILSLIPVETTVTARRSDNHIMLDIEGDNSGLLIGRRGKTLDALQFIVNKIVNKTLEKKTRIVVDSEKYRMRRKESLTQLALRMGDKAKRIRKPVTTNPMNPGDRRIVHLALKEDSELDTRSRGEGLLKKVAIIPRRQ
jgi:spoIIIJ-associated protein